MEKKKERRKAIHMRTEDVKLLLFSAYMNVHIGNPKEYTKWLQKLISEFSKVNNYTIKLQKVFTRGKQF